MLLQKTGISQVNCEKKKKNQELCETIWKRITNFVSETNNAFNQLVTKNIKYKF